MIRATLDTNVFVSALNFSKGIPNRILTLVEADAFTLCISQSIIDEIRRVLLTRFEWSEKDLQEVLDPLLSLAEVVEPKTGVIASRDPKDDHILACAQAAGAEVIVTGDDDLLCLSPYEKIQIVTPREFIELLDSRSG